MLLPDETKVCIRKLDLAEANSFIESVKCARLLQPDGNPNKEWSVISLGRCTGDPGETKYGNTSYDLMGGKAESAFSAEWQVIADAFSDAEWNFVGNLKAMGAWDGALHKVVEAAENAVEIAAEKAGIDIGESVVLSAKECAATVAGLLAVKSTWGVQVKDLEKHLEHAKALWEVWGKGYVLPEYATDRFYVFSTTDIIKRMARV